MRNVISLASKPNKAENFSKTYFLRITESEIETAIFMLHNIETETDMKFWTEILETAYLKFIWIRKSHILLIILDNQDQHKCRI